MTAPILSNKQKVAKAFEKTLYTPELLRHVQGLEEELATPPHKVTLTTCDVNGNAKTYKDVGGPNKEFKFFAYQPLALSYHFGIQDTGFGYELITIGDKAKDEFPTSPEQCCRKDNDLVKFRKLWGEKWLESDVSRAMKAHIKKHAKTMEPVKKIICIGLGKLLLADAMQDYHTARAYVQHFAANMIRQVLQDEQGNGPIEMWAQDPAYCTDCKAILNEDFDMKFYKGQVAAFLDINPNTFVFTVSPSLPVRQIIGDLIESNGGPAGMVCDAIDDDGLTTAFTVDPNSPRLHKFRTEKMEAIGVDDEDAVVKMMKEVQEGVKIEVETLANVFFPASLGIYARVKK